MSTNWHGFATCFCRALKMKNKLKNAFEFPNGLCLPRLTRETIPKNSTTVAETTFVIICLW